MYLDVLNQSLSRTKTSEVLFIYCDRTYVSFNRKLWESKEWPFWYTSGNETLASV